MPEDRSHAGDEEHSRARKKPEQKWESKLPHKLVEDIRQIIAGKKAEEFTRQKSALGRLHFKVLGLCTRGDGILCSTSPPPSSPPMIVIHSSQLKEQYFKCSFLFSLANVCDVNKNAKFSGGMAFERSISFLAR